VPIEPVLPSISTRTRLIPGSLRSCPPALTDLLCRAAALAKKMTQK
jgi:hypothetical protein